MDKSPKGGLLLICKCPERRGQIEATSAGSEISLLWPVNVAIRVNCRHCWGFPADWAHFNVRLVGDN
eukprot:10185637-Alexandrium_andersonii.AAC.1